MNMKAPTIGATTFSSEEQTLEITGARAEKSRNVYTG
jgi:hypothetical protein